MPFRLPGQGEIVPFSTYSSPSFLWHVTTDRLIFCVSALASLGLAEGNAPATMEALLEHLPARQRLLLQQQRTSLLADSKASGRTGAYTYNGKDVNEYLHVIRRDAEGRPLTVLICLELLEGVSPLPEDSGGGYWTYTRERKQFCLDIRCAALLGLGGRPGPLDGNGWRRLRRNYRTSGLISRMRHWLNSVDGPERLRLLLMPCRPQGTQLLLTAAVLTRDAQGRAAMVAGGLTPAQEHKTASATGTGRLLLAMENCCDGLWDWDATTNKVYYSQSYLAMLGHTSASFPAELDSWAYAVHPDDFEKTVALQMRIAASPDEGDSFACTYRIRRADGSWLWVLGRGCVTSRDAAGRALRIVSIHTDITSLQQERDVLEGLVLTDQLTGASNRYHLERFLRQPRRIGSPLCVVMADVDGLKLINDHLGHGAGDNLLRSVAGLLQSHVRSEDCVARTGGDEFALIFSCSQAVVRQRLEDIRRMLADRQDGSLPIEISFGMAGSDDGSIPAETLLHQADARMLREKKRRRTASHARIRAWLEQHTGQAVTGDDCRL